MRRGIQIAAFAVGASLVLAGCAGGGSPTNTGGGDDEKVTIRFSWWGSDSRHKLTQEVIDLLEEQNPNITVEAEPGTWDGYWDSLATKAATGEMPDVVQTVDPYVLEYGRNGQLADLTQFGDQLDLSPYDDAILTDSAEDGKVYGVPGGLTTYSIWTNPDVLEKAGIDLPDDKTWSWDDYADFANEVTSKAPGAVGTTQLSFYSEPFTIWARQHGEQRWDGDKIGFTQETLASWWEYVLKLSKSGAMLSPELSTEQNGIHDADIFAAGNAAFKPSWATQLTQVGPLNDTADLQLLQPPGEDGADARGNWVKPSLHYSIAESSKHKEAAAKLINFIINTPEAGKILGADRGLPPNPEVLAAVQDTFGVADQKAAAYLAEQNEIKANPRPVAPEGASELDTLFKTYSEQVLYGSLTPDQAAEQLITELEAALG